MLQSPSPSPQSLQEAHTEDTGTVLALWGFDTLSIVDLLLLCHNSRGNRGEKILLYPRGGNGSCNGKVLGSLLYFAIHVLFLRRVDLKTRTEVMHAFEEAT